MSSKLFPELLVDEDGGPYVRAELTAFRIFGRKFDEIVDRAEQVGAEQYDSLMAQIDRALPNQYEATKRVDAQLERRIQEQPELGGILREAMQRFEGVLEAIDQAEEEDSESAMSASSAEESTPVAAENGFKIFLDVRSHEEITADHRMLVDWLLSNQEAIAQTVRTKIYELYRDVYPSYKQGFDLQNDPTTPIVLPEIKTGDELDDRIRLSSVLLMTETSEIALGFDCTWDDEHGLSISLIGIGPDGYSEIVIGE